MSKKHISAKQVGCALASAVLASALAGATAGSAYALGNMSEFPAPTKATSVDKDLITIGAAWTTYGEILGLTSINGDGTIDLAGWQAGGGGQGNMPWGIVASDVNQKPSPYQYNSFYNLYAAANNLTPTSSDNCSVAFKGKPDVADSKLVAELGNISKTVSMRPDILMGCDGSSHATGNSIVLKNGGKAVSVAKSSLATNVGYSDQIKTVNEFKTNNPEFYKAGDENWDPYLVENASFYGDTIDSSDGNTQTVGAYSLYTVLPSMYRLAVAADGVMSDNSAKHGRYSECPLTIAQKYEAYAKGLQDYVLKNIDSNKIKKKSVAIVASGKIDTEAQTASCYKSTMDGSVKAAATNDQGGAQLSRTVEVVENTTNNIAGIWDTKDTTATAALRASDLMKADVILLDSAADQQGLTALLEAAGYTDQSKWPSIFVNGVSNASAGATRGWSADTLQNVGVYMGFIYPEVINPVHALAYYYSQFYHVKSDTSTLSNVMGMYTKNMSLPKGVSLSLSGYKTSTVQKQIDQGIAYYKANKKSIDSKRPKLTLSKYYSMTNQKVKISTSSLKIKAGKSSKVKASAKTKVTYTAAKAAKGKIKLSTAGKVTVAKSTKAGTYKLAVKAKAKGSNKYTAASASKTIKIKVTKK